MTLGKIEFGILIFPSLATTEATLARDISKHLTNPKNRGQRQGRQGASETGRRPRWCSTTLGHKRRSSAQRQLASQNQAASRER
jgi:hypothetical protein